MEQLFHFSELERREHGHADVGLRDVQLRFRDQHLAVPGGGGQPVLQRPPVHAGRANERGGLPAQLRPPGLLQRVGPGRELQHADGLPGRGRDDEPGLLPPPPALSDGRHPVSAGRHPAAGDFPVLATELPVPAGGAVVGQPDQRILELVGVPRTFLNSYFFVTNVTVVRLKSETFRGAKIVASFNFVALLFDTRLSVVRTVFNTF